MIIFIICALFGVYTMVRGAWGWSDAILGSMLGLIVGGMTGFLIALALPQTTEVNTYTHEIVSLQDNTSISGNFFLGSGNIDGKMQYVYYYKVDNGYKMNVIPYEDAIVNYKKSPQIIITKREPIDDWTMLFAIDTPKTIGYEISVPKGTIKNNYNLDSK